MRRFAQAAGLIAVTLLGSARVGAEPAIEGMRPAYNTAPVSDVPNAQAISRHRWAPGLDAGYTPQGLVVAGGRVRMVGYGPGGCRIFDVNGAPAIAVPGCKHGGGLAATGGRLIVIDTRALFVVSGGRVTRQITLTGALRGSFGEADSQDLWIGSYERDGQGGLWRIPLAKLSQDSLSEADAAATLIIPARAQGMTFRRGELWLTFSGSTFGRLSRIDPSTGAEIARYDMPAGIEDLGTDSSGLIWAVSEAGAKKYTGWKTNFPLIFAINPALLKE
ncbi:MAG: hypothetical protein FD175_973 [Beijerinckiaceae bacterium]|nr:MAG: hypothetical protein FD175_973 [Beijerinckiaceae bacterium]